jgi:adenylosuccinate synthase
MSHVIVVDLGYGDSGKGGVVAWLCAPRAAADGLEPARTVIRFNGGAQAAHNVVTTDGRHHTFAQFGSGSFTPGVRTHLSRFMLVDPLALAAEAAHLALVGVGDALDRLTVDRDALLTTPYHRAANRVRELARGQQRHGSCGVGIGETARYALENPADAPRVADCAAPGALARKLARLRDRLADELGLLDGPGVADVREAYRAFADRVRLVDAGYLARVLRAGPVVFEGAQGVLLDEWHGFHPYTTWSTTTSANAEELLAEADAAGAALRLGVVRCYMTRHGPGPFVTEDPTLELPEPHNQHGTWQGPFRTGHFDGVALRYAIEVTGGVDAVALTHLDLAPLHRQIPGTENHACDPLVAPGPAAGPVRHAGHGRPRRPPAAVRGLVPGRRRHGGHLAQFLTAEDEEPAREPGRKRVPARSGGPVPLPGDPGRRRDHPGRRLLVRRPARREVSS